MGETFGQRALWDAATKRGEGEPYVPIEWAETPDPCPVTCKWCDAPAEIVLIPLSPHGRTGRLSKLAEPVCLGCECPGPNGSGRVPLRPKPKSVLSLEAQQRRYDRAPTYADRMLRFIRSPVNCGDRWTRRQCENGTSAPDSGRWNWVSVSVWQVWLAGRQVWQSLGRRSPDENVR